MRSYKLKLEVIMSVRPQIKGNCKCLCNSCNIGTFSDLPDVYAQSPRAAGL